MSDGLKIQVDPGSQFGDAISKAMDQVGDLTVPYGMIIKSWFQGNRAIFAQRGPGKYQDLSDRYKVEKKKAVGFIYPILRRSGALEASITREGNSNSIAQILNQQLQFGSKLIYTATHQYGRGHIPARPVILFGDEPLAPDELKKRIPEWTQIIQDYVLKVSAGFSSPK